MNINAYQYFTALARELNMTRTAQKLGISQQALSTQILRLETYYGVQLFERIPRLRLTYAGKLLYQYSVQVSGLSMRIKDALHEVRAGERGQIFIGTTAKRSYSILPQVFPPFHREFPGIEVCMQEASTPSLIQNMLEEKTDLTILITSINHPDVVSVPLMEERSLLMVSDEVLRQYCSAQYSYLLQNSHTLLSIRYFKDCPFILNSTENRVRKNCDFIFAANGIVPHVIFSSTNAMNLAQLASQGLGATFLNSSTRPETIQNLHCFMIEGISEPEILKISYLRTHFLSQPAQRFIEIAREHLPKTTALPQNTPEW